MMREQSTPMKNTVRDATLLCKKIIYQRAGTRTHESTAGGNIARQKPTRERIIIIPRRVATIHGNVLPLNQDVVSRNAAGELVPVLVIPGPRGTVRDVRAFGIVDVLWCAVERIGDVFEGMGIEA